MSMIPVITIVGRPNVGKSTLFNCFTRSRDAIVADMPGVTRDRQYGEGEFDGQRFIVIDTGGLETEAEGVSYQMAGQVKLAIEEADCVLFIVDAKEGVTAQDAEIARALRGTGKAITLVVNKIDGLDADVVMSEFYQLGLGDVFGVAAAHRRGVNALQSALLSNVKVAADQTEQPASEAQKLEGIKVAIVGRPNAGKSTLLNRILGEDRVVVFDEPGTTRDSIFVPFERLGQQYVMIDTAGVRRKARVKEAVEKFSVVKTLRAIEAANVVVMVIDARENISEQDLRLLGFVIDAGKALVIAVNKWDGMKEDEKNRVKKELDRRLVFCTFAETYFISALHGTGVGNVFKGVQRAYKSAMKKINTAQLTVILEHAVKKHQPPLARGRRIKLRYAHPGGYNPPLIIIHGNQTGRLPRAYQLYLSNTFREVLQLKGTPVRLEFKSGDNPFAGRKNKLTPRQVNKRQRLMKHAKRKRK